MVAGHVEEVLKSGSTVYLRVNFIGRSLTLSLPVTRICVNYSTVYNDTLVAKGLKWLFTIDRRLLEFNNDNNNTQLVTCRMSMKTY